MALPLLKTEVNDDDLAFGFNTKHKNIVIDTIKSSFMSEEHQKEIIHCFNQRLNCLEVQNYNPI